MKIDVYYKPHNYVLLKIHHYKGILRAEQVTGTSNSNET